jgi:hypothetical protein
VKVKRCKWVDLMLKTGKKIVGMGTQWAELMKTVEISEGISRTWATEIREETQ